MLTPSKYGSPVEEDRGGHVPWLPGENPGDLMPKLVHRRAKRIIPDDEKDDKYWEKRKRNNMVSASPLCGAVDEVHGPATMITAFYCRFVVYIECTVGTCLGVINKKIQTQRESVAYCESTRC